MFRFHRPRKVITLFHKASSLASLQSCTPEEFELNITEHPPTLEQLKSILEYIGTQRASMIVRGAKNEAEAMEKLKENADSFQKPVAVDWKNRKALAGDDTSEILKVVEKMYMAD